MQLGSGVAMAVASSCSSNSTPSLGASYAIGVALKRQKKKKKKTKKLNIHKLHTMFQRIAEMVSKKWLLVMFSFFLHLEAFTSQ